MIFKLDYELHDQLPFVGVIEIIFIVMDIIDIDIK